MAAVGRSHRPPSRASVERRGHSARHALRRAGLCRFRLDPLAPRSSSVLSHRTLLKKIDRSAHGPPAPALFLASSGLDYFTGRLTQAPDDADFALSWAVSH